MTDLNKKNGSRLRIGIDATDIDMDMFKGGIYHYIINLISNLREIDKDNQYIIFFNYFLKYHKPNIEKAIQAIEGQNIHAKLSRCPRVLRKKLHLPINLFIGNVDIFHGPFDKMPFVFGCKKIVTVHDLRYFEMFPMSPKLIPELADYDLKINEYKDWNKFMNGMRKKVAAAVNKTDFIITVSQYTKNSLLRFFSVRPEKIFVVHNGISSIFTPITNQDKLDRVIELYGIQEDYILFVGHLDPLKNILRMIDAFHSVKSANSSIKHKLVIITPTSRDNWFCDIVFQKIGKLALENEIYVLHNLPGVHLPFFYNRATALLLPSLYEGFGLPVIEAMGCGTPVIASHICSLPEIAGDTAIFVDPYSINSIADGINRILSDRNLKEELSCKGLEHSKRFNWEKTADETLNVYREIKKLS